MRYATDYSRCQRADHPPRVLKTWLRGCLHRLFPSVRLFPFALPVLLGGFLSLNVHAAVPGNDTCSGAIIIPGNGPFPHLTSIVDLKDALNNETEAPTPDCANLARTNLTRGVWFRLQPAATAFYEISACDTVTGTSEEDTVMAIYAAPNGCSGTVTPIACSDDDCRRQSELLVELTLGVRYYIVIWQYTPNGLNPAVAGNVQLRVNRLQPPANESCLTAAPLVLGVPVAGSTLLAANDHELADPGCFTGVGNESAAGDGRDVVYRFVAPAAGEYSFRVMDYAGGDLVLYLAGSCPPGGAPSQVTGCLGAGNRSSASTSEEVLCVPLSAFQEVFLIVDEQTVVDRPSVGGGFRLEASRCVRESEPNDFPQNANAFLCGIVGAIEHEDAQDFYSLGAPVPGARVFAMVDGESASRTDFDLRITTETDVMEYDRQDNDLLFGNFSPNVAGTPLPGGPAYALVTFFGTAGFSGAEPYHLYAVVQPPIESAISEVEPNDVVILANESPRNYFSGSLTGPAPSADVDYFEFQATAGDLVFLSLDGDPLRDETPIDAAVALLDASGTVVLGVDDPADRSTTNRTTFFFAAQFPYSPGEAMVYRVAQTGTYYAQVRIGVGGSTESDGAGDYLLSISKNCLVGSSGAVMAPRFLSATRDGGSVALVLEGLPGNSYRIEASAAFDEWSTLGFGTVDGSGLLHFEEADVAGETRFYRAVWP